MEIPMRFLLSAILMFLPVAASANALWLERGPSGMELVYGDFGGNARDGLLQRLERMPAAKSFGASGDHPVKLERRGAGFLLRGLAAESDAVVAEQAWITERKQGERNVRTLNRLAARYVTDLKERRAVIPLDIVPTGKPGQFRLFYDGKPLANAQATVVSATGWKQDVRSDQAGDLSVELPWKGIYAIEVALADNTAGVMGAEPYDGMRFVTTLTFPVASGLDGPPRPSPASPPSR